MDFKELTQDQRQAFLDDLTALTRKHQVEIWGCGCCDSPALLLISPECAGQSRYIFNTGGGRPDLELVRAKEEER